MSSLTEHTHTPQKENVTVFVIVVLMFIIIVPVIGAIGKASNCSKDCDKHKTEQHDGHHGESESHEEHHGGH